MKLETLITDFDGTLVDTFNINYQSYKEVLAEYNYKLKEDEYRKLFGLRFDKFMEHCGIANETIRKEIKTKKAERYKANIHLLVLNNDLYNFIKYSHDTLGIKTAIASTAAKINLKNAINYLNIGGTFDYIISGDDVKEGKPNPEVYLKALEITSTCKENALVFEDSEVGCEAATLAGLEYIKIKI